ncbi:MAG TPA: hypothetical protein VN704_03880 [Verrucomicrobiae bacterium]|nr:hypothetical protein [Verrucomicrobiae bacterium]
MEFVTGFSEIDLLIKMGDIEYKNGNKKNILNYYLRAFKSHPLYREEEVVTKIRKISLTLNYWQEVKKEIIVRLEQKEHYRMLIEIYLKDHDFDEAYNIASQVKSCNIDDKEMVAKALVKDFPKMAAELYKMIGEGFVSRANMESYQKALYYFKKVQKIYFSIGISKEFSSYIDKLCSDNVKKRLLQKQLSKLNQ